MGGSLAIGSFSRAMGYCFLEIFVGDKVMIGGDPPAPPLGKTLPIT